MRWKLLRRRLSVSAPRMIVRSHLPWPLRWAALAVMFGFSAAIALWAFEFGKEIAGLDRGAKEELAQLRHATNSNYACGNIAFHEAMEKLLGRRVARITPSPKKNYPRQDRGRQ